MSKYVPPALRNQRDEWENSDNRRSRKNQTRRNQEPPKPVLQPPPPKPAPPPETPKQEEVENKGQWMEKLDIHEDTIETIIKNAEIIDYVEIRNLGKELAKSRQKLREKEFMRWYRYYFNELDDLYTLVAQQVEQMVEKMRIYNKNYQKTEVQIKLITMASFEEFCIYVYSNTCIPKDAKY